MTTTARTLKSTGRKRGPAPRGPLLGLAYIGCVDTPAKDSARWIWLVDASTIRLGRGAVFGTQTDGQELQVSVPDRRISKLHARLRLGPDGYTLHDEGSTNGTSVGGQRLVEPRLLRPGDVIETGASFWRLVEFRPGPDGAVIGEMSAPAGPTRTIYPALVEQLKLLDKVVGGNLPVILLGETGTGKDVLAKQIHRQSGRAGALCAMNCGAVPPALLESELFGHVRGAFTGAVGNHVGIIESADGGTFFLDEIGELPMDAQVKLLRVLQEGEVTRLGERRGRKVDVRVVTATHRDLPALVRAEKFREDLYARLTGFTLRLPPLRERLEDMGILVAHFLSRFAGDDADGIRLDVGAMRKLLRHPWPFNVRGLERAIQAAVQLSGGSPKIRAEHVEGTLSEMARAGGRVVPERTPEADPRGRLLELWNEHGGNVSAVARAMRKSRTQIYRLLERWEIPGASDRGTTR